MSEETTNIESVRVKIKLTDGTIITTKITDPETQRQIIDCCRIPYKVLETSKPITLWKKNQH